MATATETKMFYSRHSYGTIVDMFDDTVVVQNESGKQWTVSRAIFDAEFKVTEPGDELHDPMPLTRTEIIDLVKQNQRNIMVVTFRKKPKPVEVRKVVQQLLDEGLTTLLLVRNESCLGVTRALMTSMAVCTS
jgi:hypothetical protein